MGVEGAKGAMYGVAGADRRGRGRQAYTESRGQRAGEEGVMSKGHAHLP